MHSILSEHDLQEEEEHRQEVVEAGRFQQSRSFETEHQVLVERQVRQVHRLDQEVLPCFAGVHNQWSHRIHRLDNLHNRSLAVHQVEEGAHRVDVARVQHRREDREEERRIHQLVGCNYRRSCRYYHDLHLLPRVGQSLHRVDGHLDVLGHLLREPREQKRRLALAAKALDRDHLHHHNLHPVHYRSHLVQLRYVEVRPHCRRGCCLIVLA